MVISIEVLEVRTDFMAPSAANKPWSPAEATREINRIGNDRRFCLSLAHHARERLLERDLIVGDLLYVLTRGFVFDMPEASKQLGLWKYCIETRTPNSGNRTVRAVIVPDPEKVWIKVVTVMWADE